MPTTPFHLRIDDDLELRQRMPADAEELFALTDESRQHLRRWLPWLPICRTVEDTRFNIEVTLRDADDGVGLALLILEHGKIVGVTGFNTICKDNRSGQIGYWLGQQHQGRGIMTRAVRALMQHGFDHLGLNRISISAAVGNLKSRAIPERLGFLQEGIAREVEWVNGRPLDHAVYAMTRNDWDDLNPTD